MIHSLFDISTAKFTGVDTTDLNRVLCQKAVPAYAGTFQLLSLTAYIKELNSNITVSSKENENGSSTQENGNGHNGNSIHKSN